MYKRRQTVRFSIVCRIVSDVWHAELASYSGASAYAEWPAEFIFSAAAIVAENINHALVTMPVAKHGRDTIALSFEIWHEPEHTAWFCECEELDNTVSAGFEPTAALFHVARIVSKRIGDVLPKPRKRVA